MIFYYFISKVTINQSQNWGSKTYEEKNVYLIDEKWIILIFQNMSQ